MGDTSNASTRASTSRRRSTVVAPTANARSRAQGSLQGRRALRGRRAGRAQVGETHRAVPAVADRRRHHGDGGDHPLTEGADGSTPSPCASTRSSRRCASRSRSHRGAAVGDGRRAARVIRAWRGASRSASASSASCARSSRTSRAAACHDRRRAARALRRARHHRARHRRRSAARSCTRASCTSAPSSRGRDGLSRRASSSPSMRTETRRCLEDAR